LRPRDYLRQFLRRFDLEISRHSATLAVQRVRFLREHGVTVVLDVGANIGQYAAELRSKGYAARIVSFEPLEDAFSMLSARCHHDPNWRAIQVALANEEGERLINVSANSVSSSLLPALDLLVRAAPASRYVGKERVRVVRLDTIRDEMLLPGDRVALKLDVQGYEDEVLKGAEKTLEQVVLVESELSLVPIYAGQKTLSRLVPWLERKGFQLIWIEKEFWDSSSGRLLQVNGVFARG
jgi:FkbM family methyltransferase